MEKPAREDLTIKLEDLAKVVKCERENQNDQQSCFIHEMFYLHHQ